MQKKVLWSGVLIISALAAGCGGDDEGGLVARAGSHRFTVDDAVEFLAANPTITPDPALVRELAELWTDYTLIALAAREDTSLATVGLDAILDLQNREMMINRFVERESPTDTLITDEELRTLWDEDPPRGQVRASHILMSPPGGSTEAQWDSVRGLLQSIRERSLSGESFGTLAKRYSSDTSAEFEGDLGWFGPGEMVKPFNDAVYGLGIGEISPVVRTVFGLHIIRLAERRDPSFDEAKDAYRQQVVFLRLQSADSLFMAGVMPELILADGAITVAREIGRLPRTQLNRRARGRVLVEFEGGELEAGEVWDYLQTLQASQATALADATDEQIDQFLRNLAQVDALAAIAADSGIVVSPAERDSIADLARANVVRAADMMGLRLVSPEPGETSDQTVDRVIRRIVREVIARERQPVDLNGATIELRDRLGGGVVPAGVQATVARLAELRGPVGATQAPVPVAPDTTAAAPDTTGGSE
jgi:parvulin-like peptidyl-prolyl cis-trans isomerase-like protein